jgi:uncharacterized integral membrane protein
MVIVRITALALANLLSLFLLVLAATNLADVPVTFFGHSFHGSLALFVGAAWAAGALSMMSFTRSRVKEIQTQKKQMKWESEDAKLAAEVQSDHVKQLEAKIATLEAALKASIKKNKD